MTRAPSLDVERLATAAAAFLVGIAERKAALQLFLDIIHLGAEDKHPRFRIDEDRDALVFDNLVELALLVGIFERVAEARTTARAHADTNARGRLAASGEEGLDPRRCSIRHRQDLPSRPHPPVLQTRIGHRLYKPWPNLYVGVPSRPVSPLAAAARASAANSTSAAVVNRPSPRRIEALASSSDKPSARNT